MLLEFRVSNYKSIRDEATFSLVASKDKKLVETNLLRTEIRNIPYLVRSAALYGPNASGKSTLLQAMGFMRGVVADSASLQPGQIFNVQPFRLDTNFLNKPSKFEVSFILNGVRHQYGFSMTSQRVIDEWLLVYKTAKPQQWFIREYEEETQSYNFEFSSHLIGSRKVWQDATRSNALFLSTAAQLNSELLSPIYKWLVENLVYFGAGMMLPPEFTTELLRTDLGKREVRDFLSSADISISEVRSVSRQGFQEKIMFGVEGSQVTREEKEILMPQFLHETEKGSASFELHEESQGTQRLYTLAAPILDVLKNGRVLIVDELDGSLHPLLVRQLIRMFHQPTLNPLGAQLIFSTHDTSLLDRAVYRRDQIWFTEKDSDQATSIYPLTDFSPREKEAWERGYLIGRYGAVPFFDEPESLTQIEGVVN